MCISQLTSIPTFNTSDLMDQWRDANQAGEGCAFGPDDASDIYEAAEIEGATILCELTLPNCYLVEWSGDCYVICDCNGWWACRVEA